MSINQSVVHSCKDCLPATYMYGLPIVPHKFEDDSASSLTSCYDFNLPTPDSSPLKHANPPGCCKNNSGLGRPFLSWRVHRVRVPENSRLTEKTKANTHTPSVLGHTDKTFRGRLSFASFSPEFVALLLSCHLIRFVL